MPNVTANGIQIEYDTFGDSMSSPLLLIMGLGAQMVAWEEEFCELLAENGLYVIRFDNRDVGLSTKFEEAGVPDIMAAVTASMQGQEVQAPYTLDNMADDAVGLLDALGIEKAHICGVSMGAAITQTIGYRHPSRVLSLIPIMGPTGNPELPRDNPEVMELFLTPAPEEREAYIEHHAKRSKVIWGSLNYDEEDVLQRATREYDRAFYPQGMARQFVAAFAHGDRKSRLASVTAPTLVIQGAEDPLIPVENGKDTAEAIPGAELLIVDGMGHSLPRDAWPKIVDAIAKHTGNVTS
jgi:pimeloyl-ACP methyl ester carboxylesterase